MNLKETNTTSNETTYYDEEYYGEDYISMDPEEKAELIEKVKFLSYAWFGTHLWIIIVGTYVAVNYRSRFRWQPGWWTK